ncbi:MAG: YdcF family protein [Clostridiales bacterium]|nr:YdcF family protein [Clostridiales bacterium]
MRNKSAGNFGRDSFEQRLFHLREPRKILGPKARKVIRFLLICAIAFVCFIAFVNIFVVASTSGDIMAPEDAAAWAQKQGGADAVLVLGASVVNNEPSPILADRLDAAMETFKAGASNLLLLSGDNGTVSYNEVQGMKNYVLANGAAYGIAESNIYLDYAGFSTYDSMYRFRDVFQGKRVVIVTQRYHLYRALYIAKQLGIDAVGVAAPDRVGGQASRDLREIPARVKDFFLSFIQSPPSILGEPVPLIYPSTQASTDSSQQLSPAPPSPVRAPRPGA